MPIPIRDPPPHSQDRKRWDLTIGGLSEERRRRRRNYLSGPDTLNEMELTELNHTCKRCWDLHLEVDFWSRDERKKYCVKCVVELTQLEILADYP